MPKADITQRGKKSSFDHLVGATEHGKWDSDTQRLGGLEVDDQLDFRRLLDWQVGRLVTLEDPGRLSASQAVCVLSLRSIAQQTPGRSEVVPLVDRGQ